MAHYYYYYYYEGRSLKSPKLRRFGDVSSFLSDIYMLLHCEFVLQSWAVMYYVMSITIAIFDAHDLICAVSTGCPIMITIKNHTFLVCTNKIITPHQPCSQNLAPYNMLIFSKISERAAAQRRGSSMYHRWRCRIQLMFFKRDKRSGNQGDGWSTFLL